MSVLTRRHIAKLLADYYAQPANRVVASSSGETAMDFGSLWGEFHYRHQVGKLYAKQEGRWLTSVELLRPFYSRCIANFVAASTTDTTSSANQEIEIVEVGGGRATNASVILSHLQQAHPKVYERVRVYTMMDASPSLLELQRKTMEQTDHSEKMRFERKDMIHVAEKKLPFLEHSDVPTVLIACELLDNLPHDKIRVTKAGKQIDQAEVTTDLQEHFVPLCDGLLEQVLRIAPQYTQERLVWVPTVACAILHQLHEERPNSTLMLADFDWLPPPDLTQQQEEQLRSSIWAAGEPIVTDMEGNDHPCYIQSPDHCDILFPTNFHHLASFVANSWKIQKNSVTVHKQGDFLQLHGPEQVQATKSWWTQFNPLLHDFVNCSVLTVANNNQPVRKA